MFRVCLATLKTRLVLGICLGLLGGRWVRDALRRAFGRRVPGTCVVIYYHAVPSKHRASFAAQLDHVSARARILPADYAGPLADGQHHVVITFDDGYRSVAENAVPELARRGLEATIFVPSGLLGREPDRLPIPDHPLGGEVVMSATELRALPAETVRIGSHTVTHPDMSALDSVTALRELRDSRLELEAVVGRPVGLFAFPNGLHSPVVIDQAREAGYTRVFTSDAQLLSGQVQDFVVGRLGVSASLSRMGFHVRMMGAYGWVLKTKAWLSRQRRRAGG